jgi:hypothetical protein
MPTPTDSPKVRLCACTIVIEVPAELTEEKRQQMLDVIEQNDVEGQALGVVAWHLSGRRILRGATARLER